MAVDQVIRTRHRTVHVPTVNLDAEALQEALARELSTYPKHSAVVERIRATAEQIKHGAQVKAGGRVTEQKHGLGWSDTP